MTVSTGRRRFLGLGLVLLVFLVCTSGCPTPAAVAEAEYVLQDDFDFFDDTKWNASAYYAPAFNYSCGQWHDDQTWLYIEDARGGAGDLVGQVGWEFYHTLPVHGSDMFSASIEIRWVETYDFQKGHVRLSLDDATGYHQVNVGFEDSWSVDNQRGMQATIGGVRTFVGGLPLSGKATLTVTRDANYLVTVASDGVIFAQGFCMADISTVGLWLYGNKLYPGVSCGVNYLSAHFEPGTFHEVADEFDAFNATTWSATPYFAPDFGYLCGSWLDEQTWLYVENTRGGVGDEQGWVGWLFNHTLPFVCNGVFLVSMELSWVMNSDDQTERVQLIMQDANGTNRIDAGFRDSSSYEPRYMEARIDGTYAVKPSSYLEGYLPLSGRATLAVSRDAGHLVKVSWDSVLLAQGICTAGINAIAIRFISNIYDPGVSCGVNYLRSHFMSQRATTTRVLPIGHVIGLLALLVADTTLVSAISIGLYLVRRTSDVDGRTGAPATRGG